MTQKVYGLIVDGGDGSSHIRWYTSKEKVDELLDDENGHEEYYANEGNLAATLELPDGLDLKAAGIRILE